MPIIKAHQAISKNLSMLLYGDNGSGKTHLLGTASEVPELQPSIVIDADYGATTIGIKYPDMDVYSFNPAKPLLPQLDVMVAEIKKGKYKFIALDSISVLLDNIITDLAGNKKPEWDHWNRTFCIAKALMGDLKSICEMFVATALPEWVKDSNGNLISVQPYVVGNKFPTVFNNLFNTIAFLSVDNERKVGAKLTRKWTLNTVQSGFEKVRDRYDRLAKIENPTMSRIYEMMTETVKEPSLDTTVEVKKEVKN